MSERVFRLILGIGLLAILTLNIPELIYAYMGVLLFEGVTNWRIPILISKARYGADYMTAVKPCGGTEMSFEAERMLRLLVVLFLGLSYILFSDILWFFPWFIGVMLLLAGLTNICPMVMALRWIGFK